MTRPTKLIELPVSKQKAEIVTYYTERENDEIKAFFLDDSIITKDGIEGIKGNLTVLSKNKALELGVKNMTIDEVLDLPADDAKIITEALNNGGEIKKKQVTS